MCISILFGIVTLWEGLSVFVFLDIYGQILLVHVRYRNDLGYILGFHEELLLLGFARLSRGATTVRADCTHFWGSTSWAFPGSGWDSFHWYE